jgi:hypothetical protein
LEISDFELKNSTIWIKENGSDKLTAIALAGVQPVSSLKVSHHTQPTMIVE